MKTLRKKNKSLITSWVVFFLTGALSILAIFTVSMLTMESRLISYYPNINDIIKYDNELKNDDFKSIPIAKYRNSEIIVFDEQSQVLYTSDDSLVEAVNPDDLWLIKAGDGSMYYSVYNDASVAGDRLIVMVRQNDTEEPVSDYCVIDKNLNILSGTLFSNQSTLTIRELELIEGTFNKSSDNPMDISKYEYLNADNKRRTLVFVAPTIVSEEYEEHVRSSWPLISIPVVLGIAVIVLYTYLFNWRLKKSIHPVSEAIARYGIGDDTQLEDVHIYREYDEIIDSFNTLMSELDSSEKARQKALEERNRAIANISHDLKTPLTVIQGYARAILDGVVAKEKENDYLETICHKALYSSELMDTLLAYTKMEYPEYMLHLSPVDFNEFCRSYLAEKYADIEFDGFELDVDIEDDPLYMMIDINLMDRCFNNLIDNSLKYNEAGTKIYFKVRHNDDHVVINIADDGVGISDMIRDRIFEPFVTENNARTPGKGTGLGMAITKTIVELHGGTINVVNVPTLGKGAEFVIILPIKTEQSQS